MDTDYLQGLNPSQKTAVEQTEGPLMIVAGAGSGKTKVITCRVAHLIQKGIDPFQILVLTFTNKAAKEMRSRIIHVVGAEANHILMGTFHAVFAKILRIEAAKIGYPNNFTIYDTEDSKNLIKTILKEMQLDDKLYNVNFVYNRISSSKNNLISPAEYLASSTMQAEDNSSGRTQVGEIYASYANRCFKAGAMDFDDLLFKTNKLLKEHPDVLYKYQRQFKYLMVDEYQDTNFSQYLIVKKLAAIAENICVVGDDAQSIYAFRGANIQNILNFEKDYPDLKIVKLEQNYRSTKNIVDVANNVISNNKNQLKKIVYSENEIGDKIHIIKAFSDQEEGKIIAESIAQQRSITGSKYQNFAILYRTNTQSRSMEEALRKLNVPYKIYGGLSFYQRKEIKDLIAYFRLTYNPNDDEAIKRVINYPRRGIGDTSLDRIILAASQHGLSMWEVIQQAAQYLDTRHGTAVSNFALLIQSFQAMAESHSAYNIAMHIAKQSTLLKELYDDKSVDGLSRYENIQELLNAIKEFDEREDLEEKGLDIFMQDIALLTNDDKDKQPDADTVSLMTIHAAKGLEFDYVYTVGMEENLFPSQMALSSRSDLEEERRLFYVAITRARKKLVLSYAISRYRWGSLHTCEVSRFINEIDPQYVTFEFKLSPQKKDQGSLGAGYAKKSDLETFNRPNAIMSKSRTSSTLAKAHIPSANFLPSDLSMLQIGMEVEHERFGYGKIINLDGVQSDIRAIIFFRELGQKQLLLKFARLRVLK